MTKREDQWMLVAGASRGIGRATALLLLEEGYSVVASARSVESLEGLEGAYDNRLKILPCDFAQIEKLEGYVSKVAGLTGGISGMLYAAGTQKTLPLTQSKFPLAEEIFRVNTFAALELIRLFAKKGAYSSEGASFVLLSSLAAHEGALGTAMYGASKGALEGFIPAASAELVMKKIRLNALSLGVVQTDMSMQFIEKMSEKQKEALHAEYPLGLGEPEDAAAFIVCLLSEKARWITGQTFTLDGGHSIRAAYSVKN
ncbi:MAG: SDR family oxidoreductase [Synergistaceae bacterium]|jgi:NAD(P)-dependent dehydrogenase (short-subunit alcohol dehydrogenase family)|nr:SDR family oxidoreductase [Synergistaceae bacterium]